MAVIKSKAHSLAAGNQPNSSLQALTAAALVLPGLMMPSAQAADDEFGVQYGHYQEGERQLYGIQSKFRPIEVDTLQGSGNLKLTDRIKFAFNYAQDTWSGATPIATAPWEMRGNRTATPNTVSGATPIINGDLYFDSKFNTLTTDGFGNLTGGVNNQLVHTLSSASPETRKQADFKLGYEWDEARVDVGGGVSLENDYESNFVNLGGRMDFNQKLTTLNGGLSYTSSDTNALLDHDALPYIDTNAYTGQITVDQTGGKTLHGNRKDWAAHLGLTQVLNKNALIESGVGYTYSNGYMENPYKVVQAAFIDPDQQFLAPVNGYYANVQALLEQRPNVRNQLTGNVRYVQYIDALDAALHFDYRYYHDDWGINAHTFGADWGQPLGQGWTVTPRVRYYSQDAADFYQPYLISNQAYANGSFNRSQLPANFSSDHRLSGYGALSGGVTVSKQFAKGVNFDVGFEYYTHAGKLKLGGGGEGDYTDFNYFVANAAVKVNLSALSLAVGGEDHNGHHHHHYGAHAPAGVMFDHVMDKQADIMVGYRYMYGNQAGDTLQGTNAIGDLTIVNNGCPGSEGCGSTPLEMSMHMHMIDLMYAPTDWLTLMLMPQFVDMDMKLRELNGAPEESEEHSHGNSHATGGVGDTGMYALVKLFNTTGHHLHMGLGFSAPTGDVGIMLRPAHHEDPGFIHYGMQLGSGTWDFKPSITYTGELDKWSWGAQVSGTKRLESQNKSGYALGDIFQTTAWGSYSLLNWLSASVRGIYTVQGSIRHEFNGPHPDHGPMDFPSNYGGRFWDVGFGLNAFVPSGDLAGNRLSFEWIQPVEDDVNGYQLEREGALAATWGYVF